MLDILNFFAADSNRFWALIATILTICWGVTWIINAWRDR